MAIHLHFHIANLNVHTVDDKIIKQLMEKVDSINSKIDKMGQELDTLTTEVSETATVIDSAVVLLKGLKTALDAAGTDPAKLAALSASLDSKQNELAAAITENTPAQ